MARCGHFIEACSFGENADSNGARTCVLCRALAPVVVLTHQEGSRQDAQFAMVLWLARRLATSRGLSLPRVCHLAVNVVDEGHVTAGPTSNPRWRQASTRPSLFSENNRNTADAGGSAGLDARAIDASTDFPDECSAGLLDLYDGKTLRRLGRAAVDLELCRGGDLSDVGGVIASIWTVGKSL